MPNEMVSWMYSKKALGKSTYLCMPGSAAVDENDGLTLQNVPGNKLLRLRSYSGDHLLGHVARNPLQTILNPCHQGIRHLAALWAAGVQVFLRVARVNVCVGVHRQGFHHRGHAWHLGQGVQVQVGEKAVGGQLHSNTVFITGTAF